MLEPDALLPRARAILEGILKTGPMAVTSSLVATREGLSTGLADGLELEARLSRSLGDVRVIPQTHPIWGAR